MPETIAPDLAGKSILITGASTGIGAAAGSAAGASGGAAGTSGPAVPWQCLYRWPLPHGHGSFRDAGATITGPVTLRAPRGRAR